MPIKIFYYPPRETSKKQLWLQCWSLAHKQTISLQISGEAAARSSCKQYASWERYDGHFSNELLQKHDFYSVSLLALTVYKNDIMLLKSNFRNIITELHSNGIVCQKANCKIGILSRMKNLALEKRKLYLFKEVILPKLNYFWLVWLFLRASDQRKLERI